MQLSGFNIFIPAILGFIATFLAVISAAAIGYGIIASRRSTRRERQIMAQNKQLQVLVAEMAQRLEPQQGPDPAPPGIAAGGERPKFRRKPGDITIPDVPNELIGACALGECVLFAGPGIGAQAGFPTRRQGLSLILNRMPVQSQRRQFLQSALESGEASFAAESISSSLPREELLSIVQDIYSHPV